MAHRKTKQHTVNVVKAQFCAPENISYLDLFEGFNELYTINIATNIDFLANLLELFTKVEIIFGNLAPVSYTHLTLPTTSGWCRSRWSPYH